MTAESLHGDAQWVSLELEASLESIMFMLVSHVSSLHSARLKFYVEFFLFFTKDTAVKADIYTYSVSASNYVITLT